MTPTAERRVVNPSTLSGDVLPLVERLAACGARLRFERLRSVPGLHTMVCYLWSGEMPQLFAGSGCDVSPEQAALRSLFEAAQSRGSVISGLRDDLTGTVYDLPGSIGSVVAQ